MPPSYREEVGLGIINPRGLERLSINREGGPLPSESPIGTFVDRPLVGFQNQDPEVVLPEPQGIQPMGRRFNLVERSFLKDPIADRILSAVIKAKTPKPWPTVRKIPAPPRSVWEALVELDLVECQTT